ncbi:MAG TPA: oligosaccharide flippase family protein [Desulfomonilaceae bacterium]|nr:oligosaccharide flippase family protein [Desulfomonilaceae bacterium]
MRAFQITSQTATAFLVRLFGLGLMYLCTVVAANCLGAEQFGVFSSVVSLSPIWAVIAAGGVDFFATKSIATISDRHSIEIAREVALSHAVAMVGILAGLVTISLLVVLAVDWGVAEVKYTVLIQCMFIFPLILLMNMRQYVALALTNASNSMLPAQIVLPTVFLAVLTVAHAYVPEMSAQFVVIAYSGATLAAVISGIILIRRTISISEILFLPLGFRDAFDRLASGRTFLMASVAIMIMSNAATVLLGFLMDFESAGVFFAALRIAGLAYIPLNVIEQVVMPPAAKFHSVGAHQELSNLARSATTLSFMGGISVTLLLAFFHKPILAAFGKDFSGAGPVLLILLAGFAICAVTGPKVSLMRMTALERECSICYFIASLALLLTVYVTTRFAGILAVAVSYALISVTLDTALCVILWKKRDLLLLPYKPGILLARLNRTGWRQASFNEKMRLVRNMLSS